MTTTGHPVQSLQRSLADVRALLQSWISIQHKYSREHVPDLPDFTLEFADDVREVRDIVEGSPRVRPLSEMIGESSGEVASGEAVDEGTGVGVSISSVAASSRPRPLHNERTTFVRWRILPASFAISSRSSRLLGCFSATVVGVATTVRDL